MDRRKFLKLFGLGVAGAAAVAAIDPDLAGWVKGAKTFFLPSKPLNYVMGIDFAFPTRVDCIYGFGYLRADLACRVYSADDFIEKIVKPAAIALADKMDAEILAAYDYPGRAGLQDTLRFHKDAFSLAMA